MWNWFSSLVPQSEANQVFLILWIDAHHRVNSTILSLKMPSTWAIISNQAMNYHNLPMWISKNFYFLSIRSSKNNSHSKLSSNKLATPKKTNRIKLFSLTFWARLIRRCITRRKQKKSLSTNDRISIAQSQDLKGTLLSTATDFPQL